MLLIERTPQLVSWRRALPPDRRVGFVPTMGYLHEGHTSLMDRVRARCDEMVVSIYVNPLQFGADEDLDRYPRDPEGDAAQCREHGADLLYMPPTLYPPGFCTRVQVDRLTSGLCGASRPGHFEGVTTVVARLFGLVGPHVAAFGEKDYQQLRVVEQMVEDLALGVEILPGPVVREPDGLALSSRNRYLSPDQRRRAASLSRALFAMRDSHHTQVAALRDLATRHLDVDTLDYLEVVDARSLEPLATVDRPARALVAAIVGSTRLIDNVALGPSLPSTGR